MFTIHGPESTDLEFDTVASAEDWLVTTLGRSYQSERDSYQIMPNGDAVAETRRVRAISEVAHLLAEASHAMLQPLFSRAEALFIAWVSERARDLIGAPERQIEPCTTDKSTIVADRIGNALQLVVLYELHDICHPLEMEILKAIQRKTLVRI